MRADLNGVQGERLFSLLEFIRNAKSLRLFLTVSLQFMFLIGVSVAASMVFDYAFVHANRSMLLRACALTLVLYFCYAVADYFYNRVALTAIHESFASILRSRLLSGFINAPSSAFHQMSSAEVSKSLTTEVNQYADSVHLVVSSAGQAVPLVLGLVYLLTIAPVLTVAYVVIGLLPIVIIGLLANKEAELSSHQIKEYRQLAGFLEDAVAGYTDIHGLNQVDSFVRTFGTTSRRFVVRRFLRKQNIGSAINAVGSFFTRIVPLVVAVCWAHLELSDVQPADLVAFVSLTMLMPSLTVLAILRQSLVRYRVHATHIKARLKLDRELFGSVVPTTGSVEFADVTIRSRNSTIVAGVSLSIEEGEKVAICGPTGVGKSLLLNCLYDPVSVEAGEVLLGGVDANDVDWSQFRRLIAYANDSPLILDRTALANLCLGVDMPASEVIARITSMNLGDVTRTIIDDEHQIGQDMLSTGERQALGICRALLRRSKLLLLDEATAALSSDLEHALMHEVHKSNSTVLCISHRIETIRSMERLVLIVDGGIAFDGDMSRAQTVPVVNEFLNGNQVVKS